ncbi:unnamed protein product [Eruca vesicaria subsp. sativa]|uniref:RRM domain-containing protein n=1 Tax=Eruca vesicaria subsp. sativa TaxID=29727 RepID=A0ABC8IV38_ERUVS|nr:unnamed protein product [Eruca vesicaria subsp. sativa]
MSSPTQEQLHTYHEEERVIFSKLVLQFARPPSESLLVMSTWFWLESFGYDDIFPTISALPDQLITPFANEAVTCFQCLESPEPPNESNDLINQIPLTSSYLEKDISLPFIYKNRYTAIAGIKTFLTTNCSRIFTDILTQVVPYTPPPYNVSGIQYPLMIPGFPHPTFGNINVMPDAPNNTALIFPSNIWEWNDHCMETENDRTLFLTFGRGLPVSQAEVKELFTSTFGEKCVEGVYMRENNDQQQSLYAKLVLDSVVTVDRVLEGHKIKTFMINGKNIRASKYDEKRNGRRT